MFFQSFSHDMHRICADKYFKDCFAFARRQKNSDIKYTNLIDYQFKENAFKMIKFV